MSELIQSRDEASANAPEAAGPAPGSPAAEAGRAAEPAPGETTAGQETPAPPSNEAVENPVPTRPSFVFFAAVAALCLLSDVLTKAWAEIELTRRSPLEPMVILDGHLNFALAYNRGGAWGLLQNASETLRRPFFLVVSVAAIAFIVSLYGKLLPNQRALRWGLPLVLGGALGNLADRVTRGSVVDFIDYRAEWVESMNLLIAKLSSSWHVTDHWPTFNVADISICVGVGLMAVDMLTSGRRNAESARHEQARAESSSHPAS
jgi:lipoprotein signal peptidase